MSEIVKVSLSDEEFTGLALLCAQDLRNPPFELRWLLLKELERRCMLPADQVDRLRAEEEGPMTDPKN